MINAIFVRMVRTLETQSACSIEAHVAQGSSDEAGYGKLGYCSDDGKGEKTAPILYGEKKQHTAPTAIKSFCVIQNTYAMLTTLFIVKLKCFLYALITQV